MISGYRQTTDQITYRLSRRLLGAGAPRRALRSSDVGRLTHSFEMLRSLFTTIWISMGVFLAGCYVGRFMPTIAPVPTLQRTASLEVNVERAKTPLDTTTAIRSEPPSSSGSVDGLDRAVMNLLDAASFEMAAHVVSAYQVLGANGGSNQVSGEFHSKDVVIRPRC